MNNRAVVAMSGGVDSSVAAILMKERGFDCIGATMRLYVNEDIGVPREHACCTQADAEDARFAAYAIGIPHYVFNFSDTFRREVMDRFAASYERGVTPNPCIDCNKYLKFERLYRRARELECDYVVTGHYARIERDGGRYLLKKAADSGKDQSYVLYTLTQEQLAHTLFPLGDYTKSEVREIAARHGLKNAQKPESQDICFVPTGSYAEFIEGHTGKKYPPGDFVDSEGNVLGRHGGIIRYTLGQRRGLGISAPEPLYVTAIDPLRNTVTLGRSGELYSRRLRAAELNLIALERIERPMRVKAKIRYRQSEQWATVEQTGEDTAEVVFDDPQRAITPGQAVVLYSGDTVIGGGRIE